MTRFLVIAAALAALGGPAAADPGVSLKEAAGKIAATAKAVAQAEGGARVRVGFFDLDPASTEEATGGAIQAELTLALGDAFDKAGAVQLKGTFKLVGVAGGVKTVKVKAELSRADGEALKELPAEEARIAEVNTISDIQRLYPTTTSFVPPAPPAGPVPPPPPYEERNKKLTGPPTGHAPAATLASPSPGSAYAVEVRARPLADPAARFAAKPVQVADGKPSVEIAKGEAFELRVLNSSPHEALVAVCLDGLDQFTFSEDRYPGWLVDGGTKAKPGELVVSGWHKKFDAAKQEHAYFSFLVTDFGKGAVSKFPTKPRGSVGLIALSFATAFPPGTKRTGGEVGLGPEGKVGGTVVRRVTDPPTEFLTIRYQR